MRSDNITFADLTRVYNEIYSSYYYSIYQSTISRDCRKIIEIFDEDFFKFLEEKNKQKEMEFLLDSIIPIKKGKTRFGYKTYCLMLVSLIGKSSSNDNLINTIKKNRNHIEEYKYIDFFYKVIELISKIKEISLENYKDTPENKKKLKRARNLNNYALKKKRVEYLEKKEKDKKRGFGEDIEDGIKMSIKLYDLLDIYYREKIKNEIEELLLKINFMSYESKNNLINILKREIKKEIDRTKKRKINQSNEDEVIQKKLDEIENKTAMKIMSRRDMKEIERDMKEGESFFAILARQEYN